MSPQYLIKRNAKFRTNKIKKKIEQESIENGEIECETLSGQNEIVNILNLRDHNK